MKTKFEAQRDHEIRAQLDDIIRATGVIEQAYHTLQRQGASFEDCLKKIREGVCSILVGAQHYGGKEVCRRENAARKEGRDE